MLALFWSPCCHDGPDFWKLVSKCRTVTDFPKPVTKFPKVVTRSPNMSVPLRRKHPERKRRV